MMIRISLLLTRRFPTSRIFSVSYTHLQVTVGQKVIYSKYAGTEVKLDGEEYIIVRQNDILAVVE